MIIDKQSSRQGYKQCCYKQTSYKQTGVTRLHSKQQGLVLVLSLVMLTALTLIGVASMESASMELRAAANSQNHQVAFNSVQSLLDYSVSKSSPVNYQPAVLTTDQTVTYTFPGASSLVATVSYTGCAASIGTTLAGGGLSYNYFNIDGSGANAGGTATSIQSQGIRFPSASCDPTLLPTASASTGP